MNLPNQHLSPLAKSIEEFLEYLTVEKGSSPLTIRNYRHYLTRLDGWIRESGQVSDIKSINNNLVKQFRLFLTHFPDGKGGTLSRKTQAYHAIAIRSFLKWLIKNDFEVLNPEKIDIPKIPERQIKYLTGEHVDRLLNAPSLFKINGKRDKAILEVLYSTGLRISELVKLDRDKINLERREFGIVGKGGKARVVFLSIRAADWVKRYLESRKDRFKPLFIRHKGKMDPSLTDDKVRLTPRSVQRMMKKYSRKIKLPIDATPHILRHSFATDLLRAGADIRSVQEMLGHQNIQTTQVYTHVTHKHLRDVHSAFHGRGGKD